MNKFAEWMKCNDKTQSRVAEKLKISKASLHDILKKNQMPSLKVAYEIEKYTRGAITVYDWIDQNEQYSDIAITKPKIKSKPKKTAK